jgi:hypothetical protein
MAPEHQRSTKLKQESLQVRNSTLSSGNLRKSNPNHHISPATYSSFSHGYNYGMMPPMGIGYGFGPMRIINNINYFFIAISQFMDIIGASSQALFHVCTSLAASLKILYLSIRQSSFRRWIQRKSKQSKLLRVIFVLTAIVGAYQFSKIAKRVLLPLVSKLFHISDSSHIADARQASELGI